MLSVLLTPVNMDEIDRYYLCRIEDYIFEFTVKNMGVATVVGPGLIPPIVFSANRSATTHESCRYDNLHAKELAGLCGMAGFVCIARREVGREKSALGEL